MREIILKIQFTISDKDYEGESFQELKNKIESGQFKKDLLRSPEIKVTKVKTSLETNAKWK